MAQHFPNDQLRAVRERQHLTRKQLAEHIGTNSRMVGRWERGETHPKADFVTRLCALFQSTPTELGFPASAQTTSSPTTPAVVYDPSIPLPLTIPLVGRENELYSIKQQLIHKSNATLTVIHGLPGVGKTTLATVLAHDTAIRTHFYDGILWAGLGPQPNIQGWFSHWGKLLGLTDRVMATLDSEEAWAKALRISIGAKHILIIIDDIWDLNDALKLRVGGTNCVHLATTRQPTIASRLTIDDIILLRELDTMQGKDLLCQLAPQLNNIHQQKILDLVKTTGGLPLALKLMGNYLRTQGYTEQTRRIYTALDRLHDRKARLSMVEPIAPTEEHPSLPNATGVSLQSIIAVSDRVLSEQARNALYILSIFPPKPASFSEEAAIAVTGSQLEILDQLNDAGLLEYDSAGRCFLHQAIADYAHLQLSQNALDQATTRLIAFVETFIKIHAKDYELLDQESNTILAALDLARQQGKLAHFIQLVTAFSPFMILRSWYILAETHLQFAYETAQAQEDLRGIAYVLLYRGQLQHRCCNYQQAEADCQQGLTLARQIGDPQCVSAFLHDLGGLMWRRSEYTQSETYLQEGLQLAQNINDTDLTCRILNLLGIVEFNRGKVLPAEAYMTEGLKLARQLNDREQICTLLMNLGASKSTQGNHTQAEEYSLEALAVARNIGHREHMCVLLANLGYMAIELENYQQAEIYVKEGLTLARQINHREWLSSLLVNEALIMRKNGNYVQAEIYLQESLQLAKQVNRIRTICETFEEYGNLYLDTQQIQLAEESFRKMLQISPADDQEMQAQGLYGLAQVAVAQGNQVDGQHLGEESLLILQAIGHYKIAEVEQWLHTQMKKEQIN